VTAPRSAGSRYGLDLDGKVAWVTGAGRGLGRAIAAGLARFGAAVAVTARTDSELLSLKEELEGEDGTREVLVLPGSVSSLEDVTAMAERLVRERGGVDVLVHSAGISPSFTRTENLEQEAWREVLDVNLSGCFYCCQAAGRIMLERGAGSIVNISSIHGTVGLERLAAYAASKGGIEALSRALAVEWANRGVRVNAIAPGYFKTALSEPLLSSHRRDRFLNAIPMGRFGESDQLVGAAVFLASDSSSYVTGSTLYVDGGWTAQ
jgi:NAD(P)-dependent dehydrogenase (short-subunit alcohol dehydrogenase family)